MTAENSAPAIITAHAFVPRFEWWTVCRACGLAEAAHAETAVCAACGQNVRLPGDELCPFCEYTERPA